MLSIPLLSFALPIFPEGSLASSVVTTVWIGVTVAVLLNLRLGWTLSGLVVPGYLVPLLIMKPWSAAVVIVEGMLAYGLVWFFSEYLSRYRFWSNLFGRDRFFALILASIAVRIVLDGYLLPILARALSARWAGDFDFASNLHSFGLIIIALIANQFWKPGILRGLIPVCVTLGITYLLVRYPLLEWTNFNIGRLEFMYEDVSASVFASPKAYIILVCTAFLASRLNLYYSWEFNGIMIPSLLALQWYEPLKILSSFVEAWVIYGLAILVLRLNCFRDVTIEGGRKVLLFFNLSFVYKLLLGHAALWWAPGMHATDLYGFGYLLPSLLAMKMHDKGIPERMTRTTLQASIVGTFGAAIVSFSLTMLPQDWLWSLSEADAAVQAPVEAQSAPLADLLREEKIFMYEQRVAAERAIVPSQKEIDAFRFGLLHLRDFVAQHDPDSLQRAIRSLRAAHFALFELEDGVFYLRELPPRHGWGAYVVRNRIESPLAIEVPVIEDEWATLEAGAFFFELFRASSLALSTKDHDDTLQFEGDVRTSSRTFFQTFHRVFGRANAIQVRGYTRSGLRSLYAGGLKDQEAYLSTLPSSLWVTSELPIPLSRLRDFVDTLRIEWQPPPMRNVQRDTTSGGFAELFLRREDRRRLLAHYLLGEDTVDASRAIHVEESSERIGESTSLEEWALRQKEKIAPRGSNLYVIPTQEALLFLDEEVIAPLTRLTLEANVTTVPHETVVSELRAVEGAARSWGYRLWRYRRKDTEDEYVVLAEVASGAGRRNWGSYVFRLGNAAPFAVEIPRPGYERNTLEYGVTLFEKLRAAFLLIPGSHPKANTDSSADVVQSRNKRSLFNLVNQVILRESKEQAHCVVQVRAFGHRPNTILPDADALLSFSDGRVGLSELTELGRKLVRTLHQDRLHLAFVDGSPETAGYEPHGNAQGRYLLQTLGKEFASLWLSPYARSGYRQDSADETVELQFWALEIETHEGSLLERIASAKLGNPGSVPELLVDQIRKYQTTRDPHILRAVQRKWPGTEIQRWIDTDTQKAFLLLVVGEELLPLVAKLSLNRTSLIHSDNPEEFSVQLPLLPQDVRRFVESTAPVLKVEKGAP